MIWKNRLYLSQDFPEWEELNVRAARGGVIVSMTKCDTSAGGVLLPGDNRMLPDIGTVISVGHNHFENFYVGQKVAVRPECGMYHWDYAGSGHDLRFLRDHYDNEQDFQPEVLESVPITYDADLGALPANGWCLVEPESFRHSGIVLPDSYKPPVEDVVVWEGERWLAISRGMLDFQNPETWGLKATQRLIQRSRLLARLT